MGARQKEWARKARKALRLELGNECALCGTKRHLEFDCITPQGDAHHKFDTSHRMSFYRQQHLRGNLRLLCQKCNGSTGGEWGYRQKLHRQIGLALMQQALLNFVEARP